MSLFDLKILTPDKEVYNGKAKKLVVRTTEGDVGIYAKHINYVASLGIGKLVVTFENETKTAAVADGFISVAGGNVNILTDFLEWSNEIDTARAMRAKEDAEHCLKADGEDRLAEINLKKAMNRIDVAKK